MRTAIIRYTPRAVGLKPSAMEREARLRGLERNNYSKTVSPPVQSPCDRRHSPAGASTSSARASACTIRSNPTTDIAAPQGLPRAQRGLQLAQAQSRPRRQTSPAGASTSSARASARTIRSNPTTDIAAPQGLPRAQRGLMEIENYSSSQIRRPLSGSAVSCETPRFRQSVDRNSFRSPCRERVSGSVQPCPIGSTSVGTAIFLNLTAFHCSTTAPKPGQILRRSVWMDSGSTHPSAPSHSRWW